MPTQATLNPCRRAASAKRIGKRPLPASNPTVWPALTGGRRSEVRRATRISLLLNADTASLLPSADRWVRSGIRLVGESPMLPTWQVGSFGKMAERTKEISLNLFLKNDLWHSCLEWVSVRPAQKPIP